MIRIYLKISILSSLLGAVYISGMEKEGKEVERELFKLVLTAKPEILNGFIAYRQRTHKSGVNVMRRGFPADTSRYCQREC